MFSPVQTGSNVLSKLLAGVQIKVAWHKEFVRLSGTKKAKVWAEVTPCEWKSDTLFHQKASQQKKTNIPIWMSYNPITHVFSLLTFDRGQLTGLGVAPLVNLSRWEYWKACLRKVKLRYCKGSLKKIKLKSEKSQSGRTRAQIMLWNKLASPKLKAKATLVQNCSVELYQHVA